MLPALSYHPTMASQTFDFPVEVIIPVFNLLPAETDVVEGVLGTFARVRPTEITLAGPDLRVRLVVTATSLGDAFDVALDATSRALEATPYATSNLFDFRFRLESEPPVRMTG